MVFKSLGRMLLASNDNLQIATLIRKLLTIRKSLAIMESIVRELFLEDRARLTVYESLAI